ncbi:MAG: flagellar biosynthesis protein FlhB [Nitrospinae bacterium]|nr:flagellar biosynthesis protein FlhB [Nitrospinota bacterium]
MAEDQESRTENATDRKIQKTREKGQVAKSMEVNSVAVILTSLIFFTFFGMSFINGVLDLWREYFSASGSYVVTEDSMHHLLKVTLEKLFYLLAPVLFSVAVVGVMVNYWQNDGFLLSWEPLSLKFNKLNPLEGFKKIVSVDGFVNLFKSMGKIAVVGVTVYLSLAGQWEMAPNLMELPVEQALLMVADEAYYLFIKVIAVLAVIAGVDYAYQRYQYNKNLKMTKQEVIDERKDMEGDPRIKARIRQKQFEMFRSRMMSKVPEAEVIITNPTHLSIAIKYERNKDVAPMVIAKGSGYVALKIREIAKEHKIPIMEDKPLAQTLFKTVDIGEVIPETMYKAVAEILAYIYKLKNKTF